MGGGSVMNVISCIVMSVRRGEGFEGIAGWRGLIGCTWVLMSELSRNAGTDQS